MSLPPRRIFSASALALLGAGFLWALPLFSQTTPDQLLFGPQQYFRTTTPTGEPNEYLDTFTVPVSVGAPFLLHIVNGEAEGQNRLSAAWVFLNDVEVVGAADFARRPAVIDRTVILEPTNTLRVRLAGIPGSFFTLSVFGTKILPTPATLTPNPLTVTVGATGTLTATLSPTPTEAGSLSASSDTPSVATVPASVSFAAGQSSVPVPVAAVGAGNTQITVSLNGGSANATVQVTPQPPTVTSLLPATLTITQGGSGIVTVTISAAQPSTTTVTLSSTVPGIASVPSSVTVPAGQTSTPITVSANTPGTAQLTASLNGTSATSTVTVTPALPTIVSLLPPANPVTLGATTTLTVTISAAQPTDTAIAVTATPGGIVSVPATVTVPAGQTSAPVTVGTLALGTAMVTAGLNGTSAGAAVQVLPSAPALAALTPSPLTVVVNATGTLTVTLNAAQQTNTVVSLSVDQATVLQVPASVTVPSGRTQASFTVTGGAVGDAVVTATLDTSMQNTTAHVVPPPPTVVALVPNPLAIQQGATGSFTLTINAAQLTDTVIPLTHSAPGGLQAPSSVTVPAGQTSVTFPVTGLIFGSATLTASINNTSASATVNVTPLPTVVTALSPATATVPKGTPAVLHVAVSPASTAPQTVALTSTNTAVATVPATVPIPAGALGVDFPVLSVGEGSATITASLDDGTTSALVVVTPAELVTLTLSPQTPTGFVGQTKPFTATGTFTDGTTQDVTTSVTWTTSNQVVATINASGVASALAAGTTTITAASGSVSASTTLTVLTPPALSLAPSTATLLVNNTLTFTVASATPADPGGLTVTLSQSGTGSVSMPATVVIPEGQSSATLTVTAATAGTVTLTASAPIRLPASSTLTITNLVPTISGFTPTSGKAGTNVTITGQNFDPVPTNNQVRFNGMPAGVLSATSTTLIVTVPPTATTGFVSVTTAGGTATSATTFGVMAITAFSVTPALVTLPIGATQQVRAIATFADQTTLDVTSFTTWGSSNPNVASVTSGGLAQGVAVGSATITGTLGSLMGSETVQVVANDGSGPLPPDPSLVAPPVDRTVATTVAAATAFLYTGANPIQTGVAPGTIVPQRAAVLRGLVRGRDGFPIPGVTLTILTHPEFGQTRTRPDGMFDLAVNGGGPLTVSYSKAGHLPAQRQVDVSWQSFAIASDVVMIAADSSVTAVAANASTMQVARGTPVTDAMGARQATILFPAGTTASMTLPGGGTQTLSTLSVRATEYTVGNTFHTALPASLPPSLPDLYTVELAVDEAVAAGATTVTFNQPVLSYTENYFDFPVGTTVPTAFYDRARGVWVPGPTGQIIKIVSITNSLADVDTNGDGVADSGFGLTTAERQQLAVLYQPGRSLWRVPLTHFSTVYIGCHTTAQPPAQIPNGNIKQDDPALNNPDCQPNSIIGCQTQTLGESLSITGTPFQLHYQSEAQRGRTVGNQVTIPLSGLTLSPSVKRIQLEILDGGRLIQQTFPAAPNQSTTYTRTALDPYGRPLQGAQPLAVRVGYVYNGVHTVTGLPRGGEVTVWQDWQQATGFFDARGLGLGGWTLSHQHVYEPIGRTFYGGNGESRRTDAFGQVMTTAAGTGVGGFSGDGGPATAAQINIPYGVAVAPDGSVYLTDQGNYRIRLISPSGVITTVAGNGSAGFSGDGGPATGAQLNSPIGITVGASDGSLYIADFSNHRVRRVGPDGIVSTVVGNGVEGFSGDGGPATGATLNRPFGVAVSPDGTLYISEHGVFPSNGTGQRVRKVTTDGIITTVAGTGAWGFSGDGGPAIAATLSSPTGISVGPDGSLYIADSQAHRIRRVDLNGIITTVVGTPAAAPGYNGDGIPATAALLSYPQGVWVSRDGTMYIADLFNQRLRRVSVDGIITTLAGSGNAGSYSGEPGPATAVNFNQPRAVGVGPANEVYIADQANNVVRRVAPAFPGIAEGDRVIAAEDGGELYIFDAVGRHLRTLDALTGAVRSQFAYNAAGFLTSIMDEAGQVTTIERDGNGQATAIVAPGGQRTTLSMEANGYLASISNPNNEKVELTYSADGLLATLKDARGNLHTYTYDAGGRLIKDEDPATGFKALARTEQSTGWTVSLSTALNRTTTYQVSGLTTGDQQRTNTDPRGLLTTTLLKTDGTRTIAAPDGTITTSVEGPDPRWGMQAPILKSLTVQTPGGLTSSLTTTRAVTLTNPNDPLSLATQTDTLVINGRTYTSVFNQTAKTITTTTPAGRTSTVTLDALGRVIQEQVAGLEAIGYGYDSLGRLSTITQGTGASARTSTLSYDTKNQLTSVQDPLLRTVGFAYDLAGRITTQTLPDTRTIGYSYDANGNVTSITPPGRPTHGFTYTSVDLESAYNPPPLAASPSPLATPTAYTYNLDRQLTLVTRPDGQTLQLGYEPTGGRLSSLTLPGSQTISYGYHATTGNLSTITAPGSTLSYAYDGSLLTSTTWAGTVAGSVSRSYDSNFRITSQSVNGADPVNFSYDQDSLLTSVGAMAITRNPQNGLVTGTAVVTFQNIDSRQYSSFGELSRYTASSVTGTVFDVQYTRDKLGRITQKIETIGGSTDTFVYTYDTAGRLTDVTKNGTVVSHYTYDSNGNRLGLTDTSGTVNGTYDAQDRLIQYGNLQLAYTANGELLTKHNPVLGQTASFTYDVLGNLKSASLPGGTTVEYVIDGQNRRIGKKVNGALTQGFLYQNQLNPVAELDGTGTVVSRFVYGTKANVPDYMIKGGVTYRIVSDHLGSPRLVVNTSDGSVAQRIDFDEFGNITSDTNPGFQPFGFAGGLYDQHTGLTRFGARDYDAQVGRWTAKDPITFRGGNSNLYGYVTNDPVNFVDPSGLRTFADCVQKCVEKALIDPFNYALGLVGAGALTGFLLSPAPEVGGAITTGEYLGAQAAGQLGSYLTGAETVEGLMPWIVRGLAAGGAIVDSAVILGGLASGYAVGSVGYCSVNCYSDTCFEYP